ncbi:unnamed protein product, partial [Staurois parvus]
MGAEVEAGGGVGIGGRRRGRLALGVVSETSSEGGVEGGRWGAVLEASSEGWYQRLTMGGGVRGRRWGQCRRWAKGWCQRPTMREESETGRGVVSEAHDRGRVGGWGWGWCQRPTVGKWCVRPVWEASAGGGVGGRQWRVVSEAGGGGRCRRPAVGGG